MPALNEFDGVYGKPALAPLAFDAWLRAVAADGDLAAGHTAMLDAVEGRLGAAEVRDVFTGRPAMKPPRNRPVSTTDRARIPPSF